MKNLKNKIKNMKGITLISLVITIIVLIILAGVTLNMLLGENGLITKTKTARDENEKATATETMNLKITNVQISTYVEKQRMPTLKELADNFCDDGDFEKVIEKTEVGSLTKISNENPTAIIAKLYAYPYEFEINSSLQLASIDGVKVATVPANDDDTIISMTKAELNTYIENIVNTKLQAYSKTTDISSTYATKEEINNYCITQPSTTSSASTTRPAVVVENYKNGKEWYRVWSDGWIEQGGYITNISTTNNNNKNFLKEFSDTNYTWITQPDHNDAWGKSVSIMSKTKSSFSFKVQTEGGTWSTCNFYWYACGY